MPCQSETVAVASQAMGCPSDYHVVATSRTPPALQRHISDPRPTTDFASYVNTRKGACKGLDGCDREQEYIPACDLSSYWKSAAKLRAVCHSYAHKVTVNVDSVRGPYLRVFSTLAYAGLLTHFRDFSEHGLTDEHFPTNECPPAWRDLPVQQGCFEIFKEHQWIFFPIILDSSQLTGVIIPEDRILPISHLERIKTCDSTAIIKKVHFHPSCDHFHVS